MKARHNDAWSARPFSFRLYAVFHVLLGAAEYASFPLMMYFLINVRIKWLTAVSILLYFLLPTVMRPLETYLRNKGTVFSIEEMEKALRKKKESLVGPDASRIFHKLSKDTAPYSKYYRESLGFYSALVYVLLSLVFNMFALPRALNWIYLSAVPILSFIMLMSEDKMNDIAQRSLTENNREREELIKLLYLSKEDLAGRTPSEIIGEHEERIEKTDRTMRKGSGHISLLSFAEFILVFCYFMTLYWSTKYSLELSMALFVSLPVFIMGAKSVSDMSRHFLRARRLAKSIGEFTKREESDEE